VDIWDLVTGRQVMTLRTTNETVRALAWSPDMTRLVTAADEALRVWPADSITRPATNILAPLLTAREAEAQARLAQLVPDDPGKLLPLLDQLVARGDADGFWRKTRATALLRPNSAHTSSISFRSSSENTDRSAARADFTSLSVFPPMS
jgi:WD40 repeat protein